MGGLIKRELEARRSFFDDRIATFKDRQRRREALNQVPDILTKRYQGVVPIDGNDAVLPLPDDINQTLSQEFEAQRQDALLGVLGTAAPEAVLESVLSQKFGAQRAPTRAEQTLQMMGQLGYEMNQEGFKAFNEAKGGGRDDTLDQLIKAMQLQMLQREHSDQVSEDDAGKQARADSILDSLDLGFDLATKVSSLEGTFLEPGSVALDARRTGASLIGEVAGVFGQDELSKDMKTQVSDLNNFKKNTRIYVNNLAKQMAQADLAPDSRFELENLLQSSASEELDVETNKSIIARGMKLALREAQRGTITIKNKSKYEVMIEQLETGKKLIFRNKTELDEANLPSGTTAIVGNRVVKIQ